MMWSSCRLRANTDGSGLQTRPEKQVFFEIFKISLFSVSELIEVDGNFGFH